MTAKRQIAEALDTLPESLSVEEALERLIRAFRLKQRMTGAPAEKSEPQRPAPQIARLSRLIEEERIDEARDLAALINLPQWTNVLAPAVASVADSASGQGITNQAEAVRDVLDRYAGQWVALRDGAVLDAAPRRSELHHRIKSRGQLDGTVFMKVDD